MTGAVRGVERVRRLGGLREWAPNGVGGASRCSAAPRVAGLALTSYTGWMPVDESAELQQLIMMSGQAPDDQVEGVLLRLSEAGFYGRVAPGRDWIVISAFGDREMIRSLALEESAGVEKVLPVSKPYKLVSADASPEPTRDPGARPPHRRQALRADRRTLHGGVARADARDGAGGRGGRGDDAARRRVQAAHLALQLPGARLRGARDPRRGARGHRPAARDRGGRPAPRRGGRRDGGRAPDRRAQHAELPAARRGAARPTSRCC